MSKTKQLLCVVALLLACVSLRAQASTTAQLASKQLLAMVQQGGNRTKALTLIGMGADVDAKDNLGRSLAYLAIQQDDLPLLELLLDNGANIEAVDNYDDTLLHASVAWERYDIAELLLQRGAKHSLKNSLGLTAGQYAQQLQRPAEWLEALQVSEEAQPQAPQEEPEGTTSAAEKEQAKDVSSKEEILKFSRKLNKAVNHLQYGRSGDKRLAKLKELIESGAELDFSNKNISKSLKDIVIFAPMNYSHAETIEILELMLAHGADINIYQEDGLTPLMWAAIGGDMITAEFLLANNADAKLRDNYNETAYDMTTIEEFKAMLKEAMDALRIKREEEVDIELYELHANAASGDMQAVRALIAAEIYLERKNDEGKVPFQVAVAAKHYSIAAVLLRAMRDINGQDEEGWTPLHFAILAQDFELMRELIRAGANPNVGHGSIGDGQTAFELAEEMGIKKELVEMLHEEGSYYTHER